MVLLNIIIIMVHEASNICGFDFGLGFVGFEKVGFDLGFVDGFVFGFIWILKLHSGFGFMGCGFVPLSVMG